MIHSRTTKIGLKARNASWKILRSVGAGAYADVALDRAIRNNDLSELDKGFVTELVYGAIRQRSLLDCWIDSFGKVPARKQPPMLRWLLHLGLYQILFMERVPAASAVDTTVELAKFNKLPRLAPVVNGILRAVIRAQENGVELLLPDSPVPRLAQLHSFPIWLVEDLVNWQGFPVAESIAKASNQVPPFDLRVNQLRTDPTCLKQSFESAGLTSDFIDNCSHGIEVELGVGALREWPGYKEGHWFVQDRSAQWVAPLLEPLPGESVLDACAAPGGKTTHLAELMGDSGEIWAIDRSSKRLKRLSENAARLGCRSIHTLVADAACLLKNNPCWEGYFHKILVDAPCSGLGTLARHPDARWRITRDQIGELVLVQAKLLDGLLPLLRPGGRMVYATCTIHPDENINQIKNFLCNHPQLSLKKEKQILPSIKKKGDGFYAAVLELN